jgi:hypothetical protein
MTRDTSLVAVVLVILYLVRLADEMQKMLPAAVASATGTQERDGISPAREPRRAGE